jgi:HAMP domain-containing protein
MIAIGIAFVLVGVITIALVNRQMKHYALSEAKAKARLILDRNVATHFYFSQRMKPILFQTMETAGITPAFEPSWMSSTYAVRKIDKHFKSLTDAAYYYKECAINARHPENEADAYERAFLERINRDPAIDIDDAIREIDGERFYAVLRRGETMEASCLRCHSTPQKAPEGLVRIYGDRRSFDRKVGEVVSAVSIRVPLEMAYDQADRLSLHLSAFFAVMLVLLYVVVFFLSNRWILRPLNAIREKAHQISSDPRHLGERITLPRAKEMAQLAAAFNKMSVELQDERNRLEQKVALRTRDLQAANEQLEHEISQHHQTIAQLEKTLSEVKQLRGILPICSYCNKIRDDAGYWNRLEKYLHDHSDARLSHGICPECARKHFPGMDLENE